MRRKTRSRVVDGIVFAVMMLGLGAGCASHIELPKKPKPAERIVHAGDPLVVGRIIIDDEFSALERNLIVSAVMQWNTRLKGALSLKISEDPMLELMETVQLIKLSEGQERIARGYALDADEEDGYVDEHDSWTAFNERAPFWTTREGCIDRLVILRLTSSTRRVAELEARAGGPIMGYTEVTCHRKSVILVVDRLDTATAFENTAAHEIGHALGLRHNFERDVSVMHPTTRATTTVSDVDVEAYCHRWGCRR